MEIKRSKGRYYFHRLTYSQCAYGWKELSEEGIETVVINLHTIKPLDMAMIEYVSKIGRVVTVEEHQIAGGMGSAVAESSGTKQNQLSWSLLAFMTNSDNQEHQMNWWPTMEWTPVI